MKIIDFKRKWVCVFLILSVILQSCNVYRSKSGTFDEAIAKKSTVKAIEKDGDKKIIKKIEKKDGVYYGLVKSNGVFTRTSLNEKDYEKIRLKNKPLSIFLTAEIIVIPVAIGVALFDFVNSVE